MAVRKVSNLILRGGLGCGGLILSNDEALNIYIAGRKKGEGKGEGLMGLMVL